MAASVPIIDAWMQHPTPEFMAHEMFASLRRWSGEQMAPRELPLELTVKAFEAAGVSKALISAWWGPNGKLLSNEHVAECVKAFPDRFVGIASVDLYRPMEAVRELRRCVNELGWTHNRHAFKGTTRRESCTAGDC